jgi:hypothetical protein
MRFVIASSLPFDYLSLRTSALLQEQRRSIQRVA